jgi:hypothetical protein
VNAKWRMLWNELTRLSWFCVGTVFSEQLPQTLCEHFVGTLLPIESSSGLGSYS